MAMASKVSGPKAVVTDDESGAAHVIDMSEDTVPDTDMEMETAAAAASSSPSLIKPLLIDNSISYKGLTEQAQRRLVLDIKSIYHDPLTEQGIYYQHDADNMNIGYAMIIGPKDTPYSDCFFLFKFEFPTLYPNIPPKLTFLTQDTKNNTRFNPNLYTNGYVCLSLLNTWRGEGWTSCQTIRSVLMTLVTVLNDAPLCNEPNIKKSHPEFKKYNEIIRYKSYEMAFYNYLKEPTQSPEVEIFATFMRQHALREQKSIMTNLRAAEKELKDRDIGGHYFNLYGFKTMFKYDTLISNIEEWYSKNMS
jgi:ubiquitin-protein ligase